MLFLGAKDMSLTHSLGMTLIHKCLLTRSTLTRRCCLETLLEVSILKWLCTCQELIGGFMFKFCTNTESKESKSSHNHAPITKRLDWTFIRLETLIISRIKFRKKVLTEACFFTLIWQSLSFTPSTLESNRSTISDFSSRTSIKLSFQISSP